MIKVIQIGFGPLGVQTAKFIAKKSTIKTVAVVDNDPDLYNKNINDFSSDLDNKICISNSVNEALKNINEKPDVAIITTVSSLKEIYNQINEVVKHNINIISTCEELSYPWKTDPALSKKLNDLCKLNNVACLGTGVNPGFLMDYLPSVLSTVCKEINKIRIYRVQDASFRRIPFQKKIGAGLDLSEFKNKELEGTLRHVGLTESLHLLAKTLNFDIDNVTETLNPVICKSDLNGSINIKKGCARGVEQIAYGYLNSEVVIEMQFKAAVGESRSFDRIEVDGIPSFVSEIEGGINGDIATCSIAINSIKSIMKASPGLHTMADIAVPGYIH
jgi:4-hydroxy-tetrahydrodipicolinate reductase